MLNKVNRILAFVFAFGLGIGEAVINWGAWQYAPLWIVDYIIVILLLWGVSIKENNRSANVLSIGWAFSAGIMYMALFVSVEPKMAQHYQTPSIILYLISLLILISIIGLILSWKSKEH